MHWKNRFEFWEDRSVYLKLIRPTCEYAEQVMQYKEDMLANFWF